MSMGGLPCCANPINGLIRCVSPFSRRSMKWRETGRLSGSGSGPCGGGAMPGAAAAANSAD